MGPLMLIGGFGAAALFSALVLLGRVARDPIGAILAMVQVLAFLGMVLGIVIGLVVGWGDLITGEGLEPIRVALICGGAWLLLTFLRSFGGTTPRGEPAPHGPTIMDDPYERYAPQQPHCPHCHQLVEN